MSEIEKKETPNAGADPNQWFRYMPEKLDSDMDNGTMVENVEDLGKAVIGHKIKSVEKGIIPGDPNSIYGFYNKEGLIITLDNGTRVGLADSSDCCAYTDLQKFILHMDKIDHAITGIGTTEGYEKWHIYADFGDVLELEVGWSCGNPFYYGYGFDIAVFQIPDTLAIEVRTV